MARTTTLTFALVFLAATFLGALTNQTAQANPNPTFPHTVLRDVSPPEGAQAPIINIQTPQNGSFHPKNVTLTYDVILPNSYGNLSYGVSELYYKGNWNPEITTIIPKDKFGSFPNSSYTIDLSDVRGGNISITVYAVGLGLIWKGSEVIDSSHRYTYYDGFEMVGYSTVSFVKDLVPPRISVLSPQNTTYTSPDAKLDFTVNEDVSQLLYSLDNAGNQTIEGNTTITGLLNGEHNVTLYVFDSVGNAASPKTIFFNVNAPESFLFVPVISVSIVAVIVGVGLLVYFKKVDDMNTRKITA